ncbi:MAG: SOS response-associated peptidase [bacterium]
MCGRFAMSAKTKDIEKFKNDLKIKPIAPLRQSFNIAPGQNIQGLKNDFHDFSDFNWGLVPPWADMSDKPLKIINARAETLKQKPAFKRLLNGKRCVILSSGYYEWQAIGNKKIPNFIFLKNEPLFAFAGLWNTLPSNSESETEECATIITCYSADSISHIHNRMPVILTSENIEDWLSERKTEELLSPYISEEIGFHRVSQFVNSPAHNSEECIVEYEETEKSLF